MSAPTTTTTRAPRAPRKPAAKAIEHSAPAAPVVALTPDYDAVAVSRGGDHARTRITREYEAASVRWDESLAALRAVASTPWDDVVPADLSRG